MKKGQKWDKSWSEDVSYSDESSEESPAHRVDQVEERLSDPDKGENGITQPKPCSIYKHTNKANGQGIEPMGYAEHREKDQTD